MPAAGLAAPEGQKAHSRGLHLTLAAGTGLKGEVLGQHQGKAFWINLLKSFTVKHSAQL